LSRSNPGWDEQIVLAHLLESSINLVAIKCFGDSDAGKAANIGQSSMGEVHILQGETIATCAYLAEAATDPG